MRAIWKMAGKRMCVTRNPNSYKLPLKFKSEMARQREEAMRERWERSVLRCEELQGLLGASQSRVVNLQAELDQLRNGQRERDRERERAEERQMCENIRATLAEENEKLRKQLAEARIEIDRLRERIAK